MAHFNDGIGMHDKLGIKARRSGIKKPYLEQVSGDDLQRKTGLWMKLVRVIDRLNNWYYERVTDPRTGTILRECDEPLTDHQGRGSASHKPQSRGPDACDDISEDKPA